MCDAVCSSFEDHCVEEFFTRRSQAENPSNIQHHENNRVIHDLGCKAFPTAALSELQFV